MVNYQSLVFWFFLPKAVQYIQSFLYSLLYRAGEPKPQPGSPRYVKHQRNIHISVLVLFMLFSIYQTHWEMQREGDLYNILGVPLDVDERGIGSRFRRITALLHPDKISDPLQRSLAEQQYVVLKDHRDVLADHARRYAYDRLGPDMLKLDGKNFKSTWDFVEWGGIRALQTHVTGLAFLGLGQYIGLVPAKHQYWRYLTFISVLILNIHMLTHPFFPPFLLALNRILLTFRAAPLLPFQLQRLISQAAVALFIALNQASNIPPLPGTPRAIPVHQTLQHQTELLNKIMMLTDSINQDAERLLEMEATPFNAPGLRSDLQQKLQEWMVQNTVRADPAVRTAMGVQIQRRRANVPTGARGTR